MTWSANPKVNRAFAGGEVVKIRWEVLPYTQGEGLDIGCGQWKLWHSSVGIDQSGRAANINGNVERLKLVASESVDYVFSSHCLEDLEDTAAVLAEWWRVVKVGGNLVLYLPHAEHYPNIGHKHGNPAHKHDFMPEDIVKAMQKAAPDWALRENQERSDDDEYSFLQVYTKRAPGRGQGAALEVVDPAKRCIVMRYGGYGDVLVASSTFPHLKAEGWHLTVYTGPKGKEVLQNDPHVDRLVAHDMLAITQGQMRELSDYLRTRCAKMVNFSETFENLLLASPRRNNFHWPHEMRQRYMNGNYLEAAHTAAGVPQEYRQKHYASSTELRDAEAWRKDKPRLVVLAASGTGVNKIWPGMFEYAWRIAELDPDTHVVVLGDMKDAEFIEHDRIHQVGLKWSIRRGLAMCLCADLVIGPETGLLNAVAMEPMPKIVLLSHSSVENLTKHWQNTAVLTGNVPCYPCHRLHIDWEGCKQDLDTKQAACQAAITPMAAVHLTKRLLGIEERAAA